MGPLLVGGWDDAMTKIGAKLSGNFGREAEWQRSGPQEIGGLPFCASARRAVFPGEGRDRGPDGDMPR